MLEQPGVAERKGLREQAIVRIEEGEIPSGAVLNARIPRGSEPGMRLANTA
jgi:hypothetical protein